MLCGIFFGFNGINFFHLKILFAEVFIMNLTTKERYLLEDQKNHEQICIEKYTNYANIASDPQLKAIFNNNARIEREHLNTINQLLAGQIPATNQQGGANANQQQQPQQMQQQQQSQQQQSQQQPQMFQQAQQQSGMPQGGNQGCLKSDKDLCTDMLMTEKYVSGAYDTAIFEFRNPQIRNILNHIQKEEQQHGEAIFNYMNSKGMYSAQ